MHVTQKEIADRLGVSRQLVTHALNGVGTISEQKRREVIEAAEEMGYRRNELARAMVTGKSHILGLLTYGDNSEHIAMIIGGALDVAVKEGYAVKVLHVPFDGSHQEISEVARRCIAWQLAGVVAVSLMPNTISVFSQEFDKGRCPVVYAENATEKCDDIVVRTDDNSAFRAAFEHLTALGHRRIAHLSGPDHPLTKTRNAIFKEMLGEFGLPVEPTSLRSTHPIEWQDRDSIEAATHAFLDEPQRPTAIICFGDAAAMIVMRVARRRGVRVPEELSVIGFGDFNLGAHADPPLTSIAQPFREIGILAMQRLIGHISSGGAKLAARAASLCGPDELPAHLIVRESTAPPAT